MVANKLLVRAYLETGEPDKARERFDLYSLLNDSDPEIEELRRRLNVLERPSRLRRWSRAVWTPIPRLGGEPPIASAARCAGRRGGATSSTSGARGAPLQPPSCRRPPWPPCPARRRARARGWSSPGSPRTRAGGAISRVWPPKGCSFSSRGSEEEAGASDRPPLRAVSSRGGGRCGASDTGESSSNPIRSRRDPAGELRRRSSTSPWPAATRAGRDLPAAGPPRRGGADLPRGPAPRAGQRRGAVGDRALAALAGPLRAGAGSGARSRPPPSDCARFAGAARRAAAPGGVSACSWRGRGDGAQGVPSQQLSEASAAGGRARCFLTS